jgi:hypothetical protein
MSLVTPGAKTASYVTVHHYLNVNNWVALPFKILPNETYHTYLKKGRTMLCSAGSQYNKELMSLTHLNHTLII